MSYDSLKNLHSVQKVSLIYITNVQHTKTFHRTIIFAFSLYFSDVQDISHDDSKKLFTSFQILFFCYHGSSTNKVKKTTSMVSYLPIKYITASRWIPLPVKNLLSIGNRKNDIEENYCIITKDPGWELSLFAKTGADISVSVH